MKVSEIIDCTCTVASISSISRFACANMWSVRLFTRGIYVTFVGLRLHSLISVKKRKKKEKRMKNWICFLFKSHKSTFIWKKWNTRLQFFGFMRFSGWTCKSNRYFRNFFTLLQQRPSKAYAINCSCFPTGAQNTLYKQKRKNELKNKSSTTAFPCYSEFTCAICPFPVYPGWQSHTCDPLVLVQFAFSWQEWFLLHSSRSRKSQIKNYANCPA